MLYRRGIGIRGTFAIVCAASDEGERVGEIATRLQYPPRVEGADTSADDRRDDGVSGAQS